MILGLPFWHARAVGGRRAKAQGRQRHLERVVTVGADDGDVRGHAGLESEVGVIHAHDYVIGDHVLHNLRRVAHLGDRAPELALRIGVHQEGRALPLLHHPDI